MNKELLMLYGAVYAVLRFMNNGSHAYAKRLNNGKWETVEWVNIYDYLTDLIDKYVTESEDEDE